MAAVDAPIYVSANVKSLINGVYPLVPGSYLNIESEAGTTLYSAQQASRTSTNYQKFAGDGLTKAFPVTNFTATVEDTSVTAAYQLYTVATIDGAPKVRTRSDTVVGAATDFLVADGGGTAGGQADLTLKAATAVAVGDTAIFIKEASGTNTIKVGDKINLAGDTTDYYMIGDADGTITLDGTGVSIPITPPIKKAVASGDSNALVVTVAAPSKPVVLFYTAPADDAVVEVFLHAAAEVTTVSGGALTAGKIYKEKLGEFLHSAGNVNVYVP
jgi:hypothetical protein